MGEELQSGDIHKNDLYKKRDELMGHSSKVGKKPAAHIEGSQEQVATQKGQASCLKRREEGATTSCSNRASQHDGDDDDDDDDAKDPAAQGSGEPPCKKRAADRLVACPAAAPIPRLSERWLH